MDRLNRLVLCMGAAFMVFVMAIPMANAQADPDNDPVAVCDIAAGPGGLRVFPWAPGDKELAVRLEYAELRTLFIYKECGGKDDIPVVKIEGTNYITTKTRWEDENDPKVVYSGHRIFMLAQRKRDINNGRGFPMTITTSQKTFHLRIFVIPSVSMAGQADRNARVINEWNKSQALLAKRVVANEKRSINARRADVELSLYGFFAGETPGHPGGGMGISSNIILGKFAKDVVQLGLSPHISFMRYQLQIEGLPPDGALNRDMNSTEWDFGLSFLLRIQPFKYLYFDGKLGFSLRVVDNSDAMTWQEDYPTYQIYGINGSTAKMAVLNWSIGIYFPVARNFAFGVSYMGTVSLTKQACVLSATTDHNMCNSFNHSGAVEIRARF